MAVKLNIPEILPNMKSTYLNLGINSVEQLKKGAFLLLILFLTISSFAEKSDTLLIYKFNIKEEIAPSVWRQTKKVFENADIGWGLEVDY